MSWFKPSHSSGIDVYECLWDSSYVGECFDCKHTWMSRGRKDCPECGSDHVGVGQCPTGCLKVIDERLGLR